MTAPGAIPAAGFGPHADFPQQLIGDTKNYAGVRAVNLGEDGETWVFLGHPYHRDVLAAIEYIAGAEGYGWDAEDMPEPAELVYTYARFDAGAGDDVEDGWSLDWADGGENRKANKGKPGYFPVVVWEIDQ